MFFQLERLCVAMKILVFAPHAAIWVHAFPEALIADALRQGGHDIIYAGCGRIFDRFCIPMAGERLTPASPAEIRTSVCSMCEFNDHLLRDEFEFSGPTLRQSLTPGDMAEIERIIEAADRHSISSLEVDGLPVGKVAVYQIVLRHKRFDLEFSDDEWDEYLMELRNTLYALKATANLISSHRPDRLIVYNGLYSVNRIASLMAEANGIPAYFLHAGANLSNRLQTMMLGRGNTIDWLSQTLRQWPRFADVPCTSAEISRVADHFMELTSGRNIFVYSSSKQRGVFDIRSHFGIAPDQKIVVATMSSYDEEMAVIVTGAQPPRPQPFFPDQIDWIRAVIEYVRTRPELFLIIRVHPREFPNRREAKKSSHAVMLEAALKELPGNAVVNWPDENISLYDLADRTDVFLNAWSSAGKEMAMLGIPVVIYSRDLPQYPADINYIGDDRESYFGAIERALRDGWSFETARRAYRWLALEFIKATVFLGDSYPRIENPRRSYPQKILNRLKRTIDSNYQKHEDVRRRKPGLGAADTINATIEQIAPAALSVVNVGQPPANALETETAALHKALEAIARAMFPTTEARASSRLWSYLSGHVSDPVVQKKRA